MRWSAISAAGNVRVALDAQLTVGTATGIGEYVRGLAAALRAQGIEAIELCEPRLDPWRFDRRILWDQFLLPRRARASSASLLHCASGTMPRPAGIPTVVTVHDLAWLDVQSHAPAYARYYFGAFSLRRYRGAGAIVADSQFSRGRLLERLPGYPSAQIHVVYPGVAAEFARIQRLPDRRTILAVGTIEPRKNLQTLVRALAYLPEARLVAAGPHTPYARECADLARALGVLDRLAMPGYVTRERLFALYASAAVAAVPSRYEGFGYAAAQALCAGVPCVVADRSSLPEVAGADAAIVGADDVEAWAGALRERLGGAYDAPAESARAAAIARFAWETSARQMGAIYRALVDR